jgi:hypothetical protein
MSATSAPPVYPARLSVDYPDQLDRLTTIFRIFWIIPIAIILGLVSGGTSGTVAYDEAGRQTVRTTSASIAGSIGFATLLMLLFRQRYPRWWFDFQLALTRFSWRVGAYFLLLRDEYPSTEDEQAVHLDIDYPDAAQLNRWLPLVKWLLAIPHYFVLIFLAIGALVALVIAWVMIIITARYPRALFDYMVGVGRWGLRVSAYAFLLVTDRYPPFSLE